MSGKRVKRLRRSSVRITMNPVLPMNLGQNNRNADRGQTIACVVIIAFAVLFTGGLVAYAKHVNHRLPPPPVRMSVDRMAQRGAEEVTPSQVRPQEVPARNGLRSQGASPLSSPPIPPAFLPIPNKGDLLRPEAPKGLNLFRIANETHGTTSLKIIGESKGDEIGKNVTVLPKSAVMVSKIPPGSYYLFVRVGESGQCYKSSSPYFFADTAKSEASVFELRITETGPEGFESVSEKEFAMAWNQKARDLASR